MVRKGCLMRFILLLIIPVVVFVGTIKLVPWVRDMSFYWTERTETEIKVKEFADEAGVSFWDYPGSLIELLERNPETEDFVLQYPLRQDSEIDLSSYDRSEVPLFL